MANAKAHGFERWSGDRPISKLERLAYERHERDLASAADCGLWFDEQAAIHAVQTFEEHLVFVEGQWDGQPFLLSPWENFCTVSLFGWKRLPDGMTAEMAARIPSEQRLGAGIYRRYRDAYIEVPRKSGKSPWAAGVCIHLLVYDSEVGEPGAQVYSAATKKDQSRIVFDIASKMAWRSPETKRLTTIHKAAVVVDALGATFKPLSAEVHGLDGMNVHGAILDELHRHKTRDVSDVITSAIVSRRQPLVVRITTAGVGREGICWETRNYAEKILEEVIEDDSFFFFIATIDKGDDWRLSETHRKANPNYNISVHEDKIQEACKKAQEIPGYQNTFRRYHLNEWVQQAERWMDMDTWRACGSAIDLKALAGRRCFLGIDLSRTIDLTAMVALFPPAGGDDLFQMLCWAWVPKENVADRVKSDKVPYDVWVREGLIEPTPGDVVDYAFVERAVESCCALYDVAEIAYDPYNATKFITDLQAKGHQNVVPVRQGYLSLSPPMKEIERLVKQKRLAHGNNAVMNWCMSNICIRSDPNENIAPDKKASTERIDCVSALVTAMSRAVTQLDKGPSVYEGRGIAVI